MKTKQLTFQRLALVLTTTLLSAGLLLTACSNSNNSNENDSASDMNNNNDTAATKVSTEDGNTVVETQDSQSTTTAATADNINDSDSKDESDEQNLTDNGNIAADSETVSKTVSPMAAATKQPSLLTNPTQAGTAENTVKLALDTLYYADVEKAATYYKVDMENFAEELKNTQFAFQQTVEAVTITDTKYNSDKTRATVTGELMLKEQKQPVPLTYELQKIDGVWKILG